MGTQLSPEKKAHPPRPIFGSCLLGPNGWMDQDMPLGTEVNLGRGDVVLDGVAAPLPPKRGTAPSFRFTYCGQTAGWMKTPLCTEVDLVPGQIVFDGVPAPCERGTAAPPLFGPCLLWPRSPISATAELLLLCDCDFKVEVNSYQYCHHF